MFRVFTPTDKYKFCLFSQTDRQTRKLTWEANSAKCVFQQPSKPARPNAGLSKQNSNIPHCRFTGCRFRPSDEYFTGTKFHFTANFFWFLVSWQWELQQQQDPATRLQNKIVILTNLNHQTDSQVITYLSLNKRVIHLWFFYRTSPRITQEVLWKTEIKSWKLM